MTSVCSDLTLEGVNNEEAELQTIFLTAEEYDDPELPYLLGSSSRRKKSLDSLFMHLKDQIYRCKEFPGGVYINEFGEVCPNDAKSGIFRRKPETEPLLPDDENAESSVESAEDEDEDQDNDLAEDELDELWEQREQKHQQSREKRKREFQSKKKRRKKKSDPMEDEYKEDELEEDDDEDEDEDEDDLEDWEGEDESWEPEPPSRKKRKTEGLEEETSLHGIDEDQDVVVTRPLLTSDRKQNFLNCLRKAAEDHARIRDIEITRQKRHIQVQKWIKLLQRWIEQWQNVRREDQKTVKAMWLTDTNTEKPAKCKNNTIRLNHASYLRKQNPGCLFILERPGVHTPLFASMDCQRNCMVCDCGKAFSDMSLLYDHIKHLHFSKYISGELPDVTKQDANLLRKARVRQDVAGEDHSEDDE